MPGAVMGQMWWILYLDEKPSILISAQSGERALEAFRTMMLGNKIPELRVQSIFEAPIEDVVRVGVVAQMSVLTAIAAAMGAGGQALPPTT
jgi:hypothetical protein